MTTRTLNDVVDELMSVREGTEDTTSAVEELTAQSERFTDMLNQKFDRDKLNEEETRRENSKRVPKKADGFLDGGFRAGLAAGTGFSIISFLNPARLATLVGGGALAIMGAAAGLRGSLPFVAKVMDALRVKIFRGLGFNVQGFFPEGFKLFKSDIPILTRIVSGLSRLENAVLGFFGIDVRGQIGRDALGRFTPREGRVTIVQRITAAMGRLLRPLAGIAKGIDDWIIGPGAKLLGFLGGATGLSTLGGIAAKMFGIVKKILLPIGILIAAFDGVSEWLNSDEPNQFYRFIDGVGAFLGDFVGAPLDLLKSIVSAVLNWVGLQSASQWLASFSIEEKIGEMISSLVRLPVKAFDFINAKTENWDIPGTIGSMYDNAIANFISGWTSISNYVNNAKANLENKWFDAIDTAEIGFLRVANFIKNIPDKLVSLIGSILDFEIPKLVLPYDNWLLGKGEIVLFPGGRPFGGMGEIGAQAQSRVDARNEDVDRAIARIEIGIANRLAQLEASRLDLNRNGNSINVAVSETRNTSNNQNNQTNVMAVPSPFNQFIPH